ncbi:hypothetical protein PEPS_22320 [Persicobacter psychrovividus]|uniref:Putative auto-transporter adhesin head GIN domain-containing protein n=2 Tax=Persicobacter psychrovividus TaxID=387638 RepID=A0ABM7VG64_9BACT|nr:hypothetical protein PEPS_22320 [Persicobacter psychrovividus]
MVFAIVSTVVAKDIEKRTIEVKSFNELHFASAFEVFITQGKDCQMVMEGRPQDLDLVKIKTIDKSLSVSMQDGRHKTKKITLYFQVKDINEVQTSGACNVYSKNVLKSDNLQVRASGASKMKLELNTKNVEVRCSGASNVMLVGTTDNFIAKLSGASNVRAKDMISNQVHVSMNGASNLKIHANNSIEGNCLGASSVKFVGDPQRVLVNTSGAGSVQRL